MTARPCLHCGDLISTGTRCSTCTPAETGRDKTSAHWNNARWKNLSRRLRQQSPFCELCSSTSNLQVDHILPIVDYPELTYVAENLRVLCRTCNGRRGSTYTYAEATNVLNALLSEQNRTKKIKYKTLIPVAQRALQQGDHPPDQAHPSDGKAECETQSGRWSV